MREGVHGQDDRRVRMMQFNGIADFRILMIAESRQAGLPRWAFPDQGQLALPSFKLEELLVHVLKMGELQEEGGNGTE